MYKVVILLFNYLFGIKEYVYMKGDTNEERKTTKGYAKARVIKRVYAKPVKFNHYDYDLTKFIVQAKPLNKHKN